MDHHLIVIFLLFGFGLTSCSHIILREYHYVNLKMNWTDAQQYCRVKYTDLATIESLDDTSRLNRPALETLPAWIGLADDPTSWRGTMGNDANSWRWTVTDKTSRTGYHDWAPGEPNNSGGKESCGYVARTGKWADGNCHHRRRFICYQDTNSPGQKTYTLSPTSMKRNDALAYCRKHYKDMAMIENDQENTQMLSVTLNLDVWIGLYRVAWRWSDNSSSTFSNWAYGEPNNKRYENCAVEGIDHLWADMPCSLKLPFWCQRVPKMKTIVKMKIRTDADLSDPDANMQILDQIDAMMRARGLTDFKLRWKIPPRKEEEEEKEEEEDKDEDTCQGPT